MRKSSPNPYPDVARALWPAWLGKSTFWAYGAVALVVGLAFAARYALAQVFGPGAPLLPFIPAILIGAWLGGFGPGLLATALGTLGGLYFFLGPEFMLAELQLHHAARLALFVFGGVVISALVEQMHRARRRAETSEARLSAVLRNLPVGVGLLDAGGRFVLTNTLMERLSTPRSPWTDHERRSRWTCYDAAGKSLDPAMWPGARALRGEATGEHVECRYTDDTGQQTWYSVAAAPMRSERGALNGAVVVVQDIDHLKRASSALEEADRRKDAFLATLAHELRNPLAPIRNAVEMLKLRGPSDPVVESARGVIDRQARHLVRLVDDLLDVSRITQNRLELRLEEVALQDTVEQALEIVGPQVERAGQSLTVSMPQQPVPVTADPIRLAQVLTNVLTNASKFSGENGVIGLTVSTGTSTATVAIEDNGSGIEPAQMPTLFRMFSQGSRAATRTHGGLGIGLWLSRQLIELHGGTIEAASQGSGKGSRFDITLPLRLQKQSAPRPVEPSSHAASAPLRVQVVEDNLDNASTLAQLLSDAGHTVEVAHDGLHALALSERFRPDAVLLDIGLPHLDGYEVCRRIRRQPWGKRVLVVAMTGWGQVEDRRKSTAAGFDAHLVKPVDFDALSDVLMRSRTPERSADRTDR